MIYSSEMEDINFEDQKVNFNLLLKKSVFIRNTEPTACAKVVALVKCTSDEDWNSSSRENISYFFHMKTILHRGGKFISITVTGRGEKQLCGALKLSHFLENWLKDGCGVVSLTRRPAFTPLRLLILLVYVRV
jgi:hypothetical protein